jgi:hypothetical protein
MHQATRLFSLLAPLGFILVACSDTSSTPAAPSETSAFVDTAATGSVAAQARSDGSRQITMLDVCDPDSFNAVIGPGTCVSRNGGLTFEAFIAMLQKHARVPSWRFSPDTIHVPRELTLSVVNRGGEAHTFTEVEDFGGGIVPELNALAGTPVPAPECLALTGSDFIAAGGQTSHTFEPGEADKYQCCIHPWMRAVTR